MDEREIALEEKIREAKSFLGSQDLPNLILATLLLLIEEQRILKKEVESLQLSVVVLEGLPISQGPVVRITKNDVFFMGLLGSVIEKKDDLFRITALNQSWSGWFKSGEFVIERNTLDERK